MSTPHLTFSTPISDDDLLKIYNYNVQVFTDTPDFNWSLDNIKQEIKDGWKLYSVSAEDQQIVAALFVKQTPDSLLTKATPIKLEYQGNGFSHQIKEFFEQMAKKQKLKKVVNYCRMDNFRMISLNETHGYSRTNRAIDLDGTLVEWEKNIK
ncbi:MAG: hypothetical protein ACOYL6_11680 [Bacteriovoracaceae bacterium]